MNKSTQYDHIGQQYVSKNSPTKEYARLPTILEMTGPINNKDVLDLACGDGYFTRQLSQYNPRAIVGIDISSVMIELAKKHEKTHPQGIQYHVEDALSLDIKNAFDICIAIYLLDYAKTRDELLLMCRNIYSCLRPDGIFATITLIPKAPRSSYFLGWKSVHPQGKKYFSDGDEILLESDPANGPSITIRCYYWSEQAYSECLKRAGFSFIKWNRQLSISEEGKKKYSPKFWEEVQKNTGGISIKAVR